MELPSLTVLSAVTQRYARLLARFGDEIGARPLVLPTSEFFPDTFTADEPSVTRLVSRMQDHAGIGDVPIKTVLVGTDGPVAKAGCGSGACSTIHGTDAELERLVEDGDGWRINVPAAELGHPVVLTTQLARTLGLVFLLETRGEGEALDAPIEVTAELSAVALGFGALLLEGSYIYAKSCGGPTVARATALGPGELSFALALFAGQRGHSLRGALKEVGTTQRAVLGEAKGLVESNDGVVQALKTHPDRVAGGDFTLTESRPWLLRVLGGRPASRKSDDVSLEDVESLLATLPAVPSVPKAPRKRDEKRDELRALVDEALSENRAEAD